MFRLPGFIPALSFKSPSSIVPSSVCPIICPSSYPHPLFSFIGSLFDPQLSICPSPAWPSSIYPSIHFFLCYVFICQSASFCLSLMHPSSVHPCLFPLCQSLSQPTLCPPVHPVFPQVHLSVPPFRPWSTCPSSVRPLIYTCSSFIGPFVCPHSFTDASFPFSLSLHPLLPHLPAHQSFQTFSLIFLLLIFLFSL